MERIKDETNKKIDLLISRMKIDQKILKLQKVQKLLYFIQFIFLMASLILSVYPFWYLATHYEVADGFSIPFFVGSIAIFLLFSISFRIQISLSKRIQHYCFRSFQLQIKITGIEHIEAMSELYQSNIVNK